MEPRWSPKLKALFIKKFENELAKLTQQSVTIPRWRWRYGENGHRWLCCLPSTECSWCAVKCSQDGNGNDSLQPKQLFSFVAPCTLRWIVWHCSFEIKPWLLIFKTSSLKLRLGHYDALFFTIKNLDDSDLINIHLKLNIHKNAQPHTKTNHHDLN